MIKILPLATQMIREKSESETINKGDSALLDVSFEGAMVPLRGVLTRANGRKLLYGYQRPSNPERKERLRRERMKRFKMRHGFGVCDCGNKAIGRLYFEPVCEKCRGIELFQRKELSQESRKRKMSEYRYAWVKRRVASGHCAICGRKRKSHGWCCDACHEKELKRLRVWKRRNLAHNSRFSITAITGKHPWFKDKTIRAGNGKNYLLITKKRG